MAGKLGFPSITDPRNTEKDVLVAIQNIRARIETIEANLALPSSVNASLAKLAAEITALQAASGTSSSTTTASTTQSFKTAEAMVPPVAVYESASGVVSIANALVQSRAYSVIGIATTAAPAGGTVTVTTAGGTALTPGYSFSVGLPVFVGATGTLTQAPPAGFPALQVGIAVGAAQVLVLPDQQLTTYEVNGVTIGNRRQVDFVAGSNIALTAVDDAVNNRVVIVVSYSASSGSGCYPGH